jgi:hypothetical protein
MTSRSDIAGISGMLELSLAIFDVAIWHAAGWAAD